MATRPDVLPEVVAYLVKHEIGFASPNSSGRYLLECLLCTRNASGEIAKLYGRRCLYLYVVPARRSGDPAPVPLLPDLFAYTLLATPGPKASTAGQEPRMSRLQWSQRQQPHRVGLARSSLAAQSCPTLRPGLWPTRFFLSMGFPGY